MKVGGIFTESTGFMVAIQDQVISISRYKSCILKDSNIANDTCRKCRGKSETIQSIIGAHLALTEGVYIQYHNKVANVVHQELPIKCGLSKGPTMPIINMGHVSATELMNCTITVPLQVIELSITIDQV